jgi:hypothetical protein
MDAGGVAEATVYEVEVVDDGGCEAMHTGDGGKAHGEGDKSVLNDVLASIFLP